ncbi:MAG: hypothetical protein WA966_05260, partial [Ornithinimicrobium sp.]
MTKPTRTRASGSSAPKRAAPRGGARKPATTSRRGPSSAQRPSKAPHPGGPLPWRALKGTWMGIATVVGGTARSVSG